MCQDHQRTDFETNERHRKLNGLEHKYEYEHFATEGKVLYCLDKSGYVIDRTMYKIKPKDIEEVHVNGDMDHRLPGAINVSIAFVEGESLIMSLKDLAISSGSACTSASLEPSYVLRALGLNDELAHSSLRFSFGRFTTEEDVDVAVDQLRTAVEKLRELSPLWDMYKDGVDLDAIEWAAH
mgnify:CR=1 FL=1